MSAQSNALARVRPTARSRVSNNNALLLGIDGRSREARRFRDVLAEIVSDLGGPEQLSEGQRQLARRCAMLSVECEKLEAAGMAGQPINLDTYGQLTDRIGRAFRRLGMKRVPREVRPPSVSEYLAHLKKTAAGDDDESEAA